MQNEILRQWYGLLSFEIITKKQPILSKSKQNNFLSYEEVAGNRSIALSLKALLKH